MATDMEKTAYSAPASDIEKDRGSDAPSTSPGKIEALETGNDRPVPIEVEKRLLRKLDVRIIPMICWVYLMNFTDRGTLIFVF
jgi:hypothetical protein